MVCLCPCTSRRYPPCPSRGKHDLRFQRFPVKDLQSNLELMICIVVQCNHISHIHAPYKNGMATLSEVFLSQVSYIYRRSNVSEYLTLLSRLAHQSMQEFLACLRLNFVQRPVRLVDEQPLPPNWILMVQNRRLRTSYADDLLPQSDLLEYVHRFASGSTLFHQLLP